MFQKDGLFFNKLEKCIGEFYVIDEKTHELVLTSDELMVQKDIFSQSNKCYELLQGRKSPCPFCPKKLEQKSAEFVEGYASDSYLSNKKKWFQYKMLSYCVEESSFRIVLRSEVESMMGLSREAILQLTGYQNSYKKDEKIKKQLSYDATHDGMTALYNKRKYLYDISQINEKNESVGIIVCDVNNLKHMNDTLGHMVGDEIIRVIADALKLVEDESNRCYRIGGDEFVVLQINSNEMSLVTVAEKIEQNIKSHHNINLSLACGWANCNLDEEFKDAFARADRQMYIRKLEMKKEIS